MPSVRCKELLRVKIQTVRLNGQATMGMTEMLVAMAGILTHETAHLESEKVKIKKQISDHRKATARPAEQSTTGKRNQLVSVGSLP